MSDLYDKTRQSWEDIWAEASVDIEFRCWTRSAPRNTGRLPGLSVQRGIILEAGCGLATVLMKLRAMGFTVIGLDYAERALHTARAYEPALDLGG